MPNPYVHRFQRCPESQRDHPGESGVENRKGHINMKTIKWRATKPAYRAGIAISSIAGLAVATGAPMKWSFFIIPGGWSW